MIVIVRVLTSLLAVIAVVIGGRGVLFGLSDVQASAVLDNEHRFFAGIWFGVGIGLAYCVVHLRESTLLFRGLMLTIFVGGMARIIGLGSYEPEAQIIAPIAIELIAPTLLVWMQSRVAQHT